MCCSPSVHPTALHLAVLFPTGCPMPSSAAITWPDCHKYFYRVIEEDTVRGLVTKRYMCRNPRAKGGLSGALSKAGLPCSKTAALLSWTKEECPEFHDPYVPAKPPVSEETRDDY